jgi:hypothetical protein
MRRTFILHASGAKLPTDLLGLTCVRYMREIKEAAPDAIYVPRKGEISACDNEDFVKAVKSTGRKTLRLITRP